MGWRVIVDVMLIFKLQFAQAERAWDNFWSYRDG
jgi:hypothetical protein